MYLSQRFRPASHCILLPVCLSIWYTEKEIISVLEDWSLDLMGQDEDVLTEFARDGVEVG